MSVPPVTRYSFTVCLLFLVQFTNILHPANKSELAAHTACVGYLTAPDHARFISSSYDVWAAASAVENLCVRNGKTGMAKVSGKIVLSLVVKPLRTMGAEPNRSV